MPILPDSVRRVIGPDGREWYVARDVAPAIGFVDSSFFRAKFRPDERSAVKMRIGRSSQPVLVVSGPAIARIAAEGKPTLHGGAGTRLHSIWKAMRKRCRNPKDSAYPCYGGRGITVCPDWDGSFVAFRTWSMANGYIDHLSLDRINVNRGYEPSNCRWTTHREQMRNTRCNRRIAAFGEVKILADWPRDPRCIISFDLLRYRLRNGWDPEEAMTTQCGLKESAVRVGRSMMAVAPPPSPSADEIWKSVPEWPAYQVSDYGRIRSRWSPRHLGMRFTWRVLKPKPRSNGHIALSLHDGQGGRKHFLVSRLVLAVFVGPPPSPDMEACHFPDPNPANNCLWNLRWDTSAENKRDIARVDSLARTLAASKG